MDRKYSRTNPDLLTDIQFISLAFFDIVHGFVLYTIEKILFHPPSLGGFIFLHKKPRRETLRGKFGQMNFW